MAIYNIRFKGGQRQESENTLVNEKVAATALHLQPKQQHENPKSKQEKHRENVPVQLGVFKHNDRVNESDVNEVSEKGYHTRPEWSIGRGTHAQVMMGIIKAEKILTDKKIQSVVNLIGRHGDEVAIKCFTDLKNTQIQNNEIEALTVLPKHANIVTFYDSFKISRRHCVVLEYLKFGDLCEFISRSELGVLTEQAAKEIFKGILNGVQHCHDHGIVHRDLKSDNILLSDKLHPKLCDFGFSRNMTKHKGARLVHEFRGSPGYWAPEILCRKAHNPYHADIWSLGIILYHMLNGELPFPSETDPRVVERTLDLQKQQRLVFRCNLTFEACQLIRKILQFDPLKRPKIKEILKDSWYTGEKNSKPANKRVKKAGHIPEEMKAKLANLHAKAKKFSRVTVNSHLGENVILKSRAAKAANNYYKANEGFHGKIVPKPPRTPRNMRAMCPLALRERYAASKPDPTGLSLCKDCRGRNRRIIFKEITKDEQSPQLKLSLCENCTSRGQTIYREIEEFTKEDVEVATILFKAAQEKRSKGTEGKFDRTSPIPEDRSFASQIMAVMLGEDLLSDLSDGEFQTDSRSYLEYLADHSYGGPAPQPSQAPIRSREQVRLDQAAKENYEANKALSESNPTPLITGDFREEEILNTEEKHLSTPSFITQENVYSKVGSKSDHIVKGSLLEGRLETDEGDTEKISPTIVTEEKVTINQDTEEKLEAKEKKTRFLNGKSTPLAYRVTTPLLKRRSTPLNSRISTPLLTSSSLFDSVTELEGNLSQFPLSRLVDTCESTPAAWKKVTSGHNVRFNLESDKAYSTTDTVLKDKPKIRTPFPRNDKSDNEEEEVKICQAPVEKQFDKLTPVIPKTEENMVKNKTAQASKIRNLKLVKRILERRGSLKDPVFGKFPENETPRWQSSCTLQLSRRNLKGFAIQLSDVKAKIKKTGNKTKEDSQFPDITQSCNKRFTVEPHRRTVNMADAKTIQPQVLKEKLLPADEYKRTACESRAEAPTNSPTKDSIVHQGHIKIKRTSRQESLPVVTEKDSKPQQKINLRGRLADFQSLGSINLEKIRSTGAIYPHTNVLNKYMTQFVRQHGTVSFRKLQNVNI